MKVELREFDTASFVVFLSGSPFQGTGVLCAGAPMELTLQLPGQPELRCPCRVRTLLLRDDGILLDLGREDLGIPDGFRCAGPERIPALPGPAIQARIRHPFLFSHSSRVSVESFHRDFHILFSASDPALVAFPGMVLDLELILPGSKPQKVQARVDFVEEPGEKGFRFGVRCLSLSFECNLVLCGHLMSAHRWTPADLRGAGFRSSGMQDQFRFGSIATEEEYAEVLKLRRDAYVRVGKRTADTSVGQMAGSLDPRSRILTVRHHGKLVGSMSMAFAPDEATVMDTQRGFPGDIYPVPLPPRRDMVEMARLCVADAYRGTDFVPRLFAEGFKQFMLTDRKWLLTSCTSEMLPLYLGIGFKTLGAVYRHHLLNGKEHHLIILAKRDVTWAAGMGLLTWNQWYGDVAAFLLAKRLLPLPAWVRWLMRLKLTLRPLAKWIGKRREEYLFTAHFKAKAQKSDLWKSPKAPASMGLAQVAVADQGPFGVPDSAAASAHSVQPFSRPI